MSSTGGTLFGDRNRFEGDLLRENQDVKYVVWLG